MGRALPRAAQLQELALNYTHMCGTTASGVDALSAGVAGHPGLRALELRGNAIGANGGMGVRGLVSALSHPEGRVAELKVRDRVRVRGRGRVRARVRLRVRVLGP